MRTLELSFRPKQPKPTAKASKSKETGGRKTAKSKQLPASVPQEEPIDFFQTDTEDEGENDEDDDIVELEWRPTQPTPVTPAPQQTQKRIRFDPDWLDGPSGNDAVADEDPSTALFKRLEAYRQTVREYLSIDMDVAEFQSSYWQATGR